MMLNQGIPDTTIWLHFAQGKKNNVSQVEKSNWKAEKCREGSLAGNAVMRIKSRIDALYCIFHFKFPSGGVGAVPTADENWELRQLGLGNSV